MNTIVLSLHGCPLSGLGFMGNEWIAAPNLDRFAAEGIVFDRHVSDNPAPAAARRAWRSGRMQTPNFRSETPPAGNDLVRLLNAAGIRTVLLEAVRTGHESAPEFYVDWSEKFIARPAGDDRTPMDAVLRMLPDLGVGPWCLWIELDAMLPPWDIPTDVFAAYIDADEDDEADDMVKQPDAEFEDEPESEEPEVPEIPVAADFSLTAEEPSEPEPILPWHHPTTGWFDEDDEASLALLQASFAAALTTFDADLGRLLARFRERKWDESAAWFLTTDFCFPLGEHGQLGSHRPWLHEELVHLPLAVRLPKAEQAGRRVSHFTQPPDLMPTLLARHGIAIPPGIDGFDLQPLIDGGSKALREVAISGASWNGFAEWSIRTEGWTLLLPYMQPHDAEEPREPKLYERPDDRWEVNDLYVRNLGTADDLEAELRRRLS